MSDIPRLAAELAERMEALGYSKGIIRIIRKCGWELEDARMRYGLSRRSLGKVIDRYAGEWRERWNRREVSHTRYAIRIKAVERMLAIHQGREPLWSQTPKPQIVLSDYYERLAVEIGGLPLTEGVGNAVRDYILNGRPESGCREIFPRACAPYGRIDRSTVAGVFAEMRKRAGINTPKPGFHAFRRTLGRMLASGGVDAPTISQVLGHTALASAERYIRMDGTSLSECALGLAGIRHRGGL